jgi:multiple sugar transport system ATP-binding protein
VADLRLSGVTKRFGRTIALNDVSFHCAEGEFFTLFGPSGAGKTTTLELVAGIKNGYAGEILLGGRNVREVPLQERNVAMAFENYALYPHFTVLENITFPLRSPRARRRTETEIIARATAAAEQLGIGHLLDRNPVQLSGGQKQRVSLARALVREPEVFLLDEPIAHLDAKLRTAARSNLKDIAHRLGTTIVYVTHDYREALGLSDRVCVLREGRVEQIGTPHEIWNAPSSDFVAHLIGDPVTNLIDGEVHDEDGRLAFRASGLSFALPETVRSRLNGHRGAEVRLGIRPRHVTALTEARDGAVPAPVFGVERLAHGTLVHVELGDGIITAEADANLRLGVGDPVWIAIDHVHAHFFAKTFELSR